MLGRSAWIARLCVLFLGLVLPSLALAQPQAPSFEQVLAAPDDDARNLDYARAQANGGHLLEAASALERILQNHPDWDQVRLFYAVVLYRLDDVDDAREQLRQVNDAGLTSEQRAEAVRYRGLVVPQGGGRFRGQVSAGVMHESDPLGALGTRFDFLGTGAHRGSWEQVYGAQLNYDAPFQPGGSTGFYASGTAYNKIKLSTLNADFQYFEVQLGVSDEKPGATWKIGPVVRLVRLIDDPYLTEYGAAGEARFRLDSATSVGIAAEAVRQEFHEPEIDRVASLIGGTHDGGRFDATLTLRRRLSALASGWIAGGVEVKTSGYRPFEYTAPHLSGGLSTQLGGGVTVGVMGDFRWVDYRQRDVFFLSGAKRSDTATYLRLSVGAPLARPWSKGPSDSLRLEGALTYSRRNSDSPIRDFSSVGAELQLVWRFGGGQ